MTRDINSVAVIGGGTMGAGIAGKCADAGCRVLLIDKDEAAAHMDRLQRELVKMHYDIKNTGKRLVVLFEGRDLAPTLDVRSVFKGLLRDHLGVDRAALDQRVFPGSAAEAPAVDGLA